MRRCHAYLEQSAGHLFLMLPLSCLMHSKRLSMEGFKALVTGHFGFRVVEEKRSPKVAFFVLQAVAKAQQGKEQEGGGGEGKRKKRKGEGGKGRGGSWAKDFDIAAV